MTSVRFFRRSRCWAASPPSFRGRARSLRRGVVVGPARALEPVPATAGARWLATGPLARRRVRSRSPRLGRAWRGCADPREGRRLVYRLRGLAVEAIEHAAAAGDHETVAELLDEYHLLLIRSGATRTLLLWLRTLPDDQVANPSGARSRRGDGRHARRSQHDRAAPLPAPGRDRTGHEPERLRGCRGTHGARGHDRRRCRPGGARRPPRRGARSRGCRRAPHRRFDRLRARPLFREQPG